MYTTIIAQVLGIFFALVGLSMIANSKGTAEAIDASVQNKGILARHDYRLDRPHQGSIHSCFPRFRCFALSKMVTDRYLGMVLAGTGMALPFPQ